MGCIRACFGSFKKHGKPKKFPRTACGNDQQSLGDIDAVKEALLSTNEAAEEVQTANSAIKETNEDELNSSTRKKVTFDLNVITQDECQVQEEAINCSSEKGEEKAKRGQGKDEADLVSESSVSSLFSYPTNFRYQNCASSDDDSVDNMAFKESNSVNSDGKNDEVSRNNNRDNNGYDCDEDAALVQEESSESLFSLSIDSRKQNSAVDIDVGEKEACSPLKPPCEREMSHRNGRERSNYAQQSVLNPIENLSQWKAARTETTSAMTDQEKENIRLEQENAVTFAFREEPRFKKSPQKRSGRFSDRPVDDEITVDTSLSSWLMGSQTAAPTDENSPGSVGNSKTPKSLENRPILGALTIEEVKQMSKASSSPSPRRSPSHSPDEMPIIGTVGSYWKHTTEATVVAGFSPSTISGLCKKASKNSKPFQTRLERAMEEDNGTQV